jgi:dienelactone hydrolase
MPDLFEGKPADITWYPPDNEEKGKKLGEFFSGIAAPPKHAKRVPELAAAIKKEYSGLESIAIVGYCWGGKVSCTMMFRKLMWKQG